ncbi:hypothetical protein Tco_1036807, partial [Tanacetum coccineum]
AAEQETRTDAATEQEATTVAAVVISFISYAWQGYTSPPLKLRRNKSKVRMTKVIKGEFQKIKDVKVEDVPLTCDASLEVFNDEVSRLSKMDDYLFTYDVEIANIPCDSKMDNDSE